MTKTFVLLLVGVCAGVSSMGQKAPVHSTITYRVKPGQYTEWQDLRKQMVDLNKKAGTSRTQLIYSTQSGPLEYLLVQNYAKFEDLGAGLDPKLKEFEGQRSSLNARMLNCLESMSRDLGRVSELSYGMNEEPAPMVQLVRTVLKPGARTDFLNLLKNEIVPAYKKAGIKTFVLITPTYGEGVMASVIPMSWKDVDEGGPLVKALGQEGYAALLKKLDALTVRRHVDMLRYWPALSYRPGAAAASGGAN
jgi:hypothetical protein